MRHRFHSICPYFAMFPESFAEEWIDRLTSKGALVADPFSGRGTTSFQALLMGRDAVACDVNDVAYCVSRAKTNAPPFDQVLGRIQALHASFDALREPPEIDHLPEFFRYAFSPPTLRQVLFLRSTLRWANSDIDAMVAALTLGVLHGESHKTVNCLSNRMPRTISTKPAYSVRYWQENGLLPENRDAFEVLARVARFRYVSRRPRRKAQILHTDMRRLPAAMAERRADLILTSPPYLDVTRFEEDQWLRLWFLGREAKPTYSSVSKDDRHHSEKRYWDFMADMWSSIANVLKPRRNVVIRIGARAIDPQEMPERLLAAAENCGRRVGVVSHAVGDLANRQTNSFSRGSTGCKVEVDIHFSMK